MTIRREVLFYGYKRIGEMRHMYCVIIQKGTFASENANGTLFLAIYLPVCLLLCYFFCLYLLISLYLSLSRTFLSLCQCLRL